MKKNHNYYGLFKPNSNWHKLLLTMKISAFLLFCCFVNIFAAPTYSQSTKISLNMKDVTVEEVFNKIEDVSEFYFLYNNKLIDVKRKVNIEADKEPIKDILNDMLSKDTKFIIYDRQIILVPSYVTALSAVMQQLKITGIVTGKDGTPLPGVNVVVTGTTKGEITDIAGKYSIDIPQGAKSLTFSFIGMQSQEINIGSSPKIDVTLVESAIGLDEVVVVGYGTQKRLNITGSVASISTKDVKSLPVANVSSGLVGRLPGIISIDRGGIPGSTPSISIRGFSEMLVIVDGVENSFNNIDPNEIESINILKDASAAIYGARAGNGVMLITTKRGKSETPTFNFNTYYGLQSPTRVAKAVDAPTYAQMINAAEIAIGHPPRYTDAEIQKYRDGTDPDYPNTNWYNEVFRKAAPISQYNLNASGGGENVRYFVSLGYLNQKGLFKSDDLGFRRYNFRSNIDSKITKSFSISLDLAGRDEFSYQPGGNVSQVMEDLGFCEPTRLAHYPDPTKLTFNGHGTTQPIGRSSKEFAGYTNQDNKYLDASLNFKYEAPFIKGLSASALITTNLIYGYMKDWGKQFYYYNYDRTTDTYTLAGVAQNSKTQLDEQLNRTANYTGQWHLNYDRTKGAHNISALIVGEYIDFSGDWFSAHREGYLTTAIDQLFAGADLAKNNNGSQTQDGRIGYVGRFNYSYASKYFVEVSSRYDASARYISTKRWGFFPSVSLGWRLSEEKFLKNISAIDNLKLRASIGKAGNDYVAQYNYLTGYNFNGSEAFGSSVNMGLISKGLANPDLSWENTLTYNIGLDGSLWKNLLSVELDVFYRKVTSVAGYRNASLPLSFGASLPQENINSFDNRGFELVLKHEKTINDLRYTIEGNVSYARKKWIHYDEPTYTDAATRERLQISGQWDNRFFGYKALGLFQSQAEIDAWPVIQDNNNNRTLKPGDIKYEDYNKDGVLNYLDNHVIGRGFVPDVIFGLNLSLQYKGFDLAMLWQGASNFNVYSRGRMTDYFDTGTIPYTYMTDYWSPTNTGAKYPRLFYSGASNNKYVSTYWLHDATYSRLKTIQMGYTIPKNLCTKIHIKSLRVYLSGFNILTLDHIYPFPMDPESGNVGENQYYHQQKSYNIGINLNF